MLSVLLVQLEFLLLVDLLDVFILEPLVAPFEDRLPLIDVALELVDQEQLLFTWVPVALLLHDALVEGLHETHEEVEVGV